MNNASSGGWFATGGTARFARHVTGGAAAVFDARGNAVIEFVGPTDAQVQLQELAGAGNRWSFNDLRVAKTGGSLSFNSSSPLSADVEALGGLTAAPNTAVLLGDTFGAGLAWNVGSVTNDSVIIQGAPLLRVAGDWNQSGTFTHGNNEVAFNSGALNLVNGDATFYDLSITTPQTSLSFAPGVTWRVEGALTLAGLAGGEVRLRGQMPGDTWFLDNLAPAVVTYVDARDSVATNPIDATNGGVDSGGNTNWVLPCNSMNDGMPCNDGVQCTINDQCQSSACVGSPSDAMCATGDPCLSGTRDPAQGCLVKNSTNPCDDASSCTFGDACAGGVCLAGTAQAPGTACAPTGACNLGGRCDMAGTCIADSFLAAGADCSDSDPCNGSEACDGGGACLPGIPVACGSTTNPPGLTLSAHPAPSPNELRIRDREIQILRFRLEASAIEDIDIRTIRIRFTDPQSTVSGRRSTKTPTPTVRSTVGLWR